MRALVYHGPGQKAWEEVPKPESSPTPTRSCASTPSPSAAPTCTSSRATCPRSPTAGSSVTKPSAPSSPSARASRTSSPATGCSSRASPRAAPAGSAARAATGQCLGGGGWILGHMIDGTQAEYVRVPFADTSTYPVPAGVSDEEILMLADILPTGYEVGVLNGEVAPVTSSRSSGAARSGCRRSSAPGCSARATSSRSTWPTAGSRPRSGSAPTSPSTTPARTRWKSSAC